MRLPIDYVLDELPMYQGWAFYAWTLDNDGWLKFCNVQRKSPGYVKQQIDRLIGQLGELQKDIQNGQQTSHRDRDKKC